VYGIADQDLVADVAAVADVVPEFEQVPVVSQVVGRADREVVKQVLR
jgi:hypothetical protein